jgi:pyridinium-3,5-bisthiocarboxylic acid mononucleotide nickel chelatase
MEMKILYFDCFSGISGDMILGALLDSGLTLEALQAGLSELSVQNFQISSRKVKKGSVSATFCEVVPGHEHAHRHLSQIEKIIEESALSEQVKSQSCRIFRRLAEAEAKVHGTSPEKIHFHEVGAIDSIVDIVGACLGFELLGIKYFYCSPLNVGSGTVQCAHGILPVPAPATAELLKGIPIYSNQITGELVTPTGAAIVSTLAEDFGGIPPLQIETSGFGAGSRDLPGSANVLRILIGDSPDKDRTGQQTAAKTRVLLLEANIDDMNPQIYGYLQERLFSLGALDVYFTPVQMKKNRPGILLSVSLPEHLLDSASDLLFKETTTIGLRYHETQRLVLDRQTESISTPWGQVQVKICKREGRIVNFSPEYEDCRQISIQSGIPFKWIQARVIQEFMSRHGAELEG